MKKIIECVPNFSEGKDMNIIEKIADEIRQTEGVSLLDVDPGADTNRTVVTFVGEPDRVVEAAFKAVRKAAELIDMSKHHGAHPRMGATDVCPLIPVRSVTMDECVKYAHILGEKIGKELGIPVFMYEFAATRPERKNLATIRQGEYEGLAEKLTDPEWKPDYGPAQFNKTAGATVVGARKFLIAYNVNLNTRSRRIAHNIALDIRERGRWLKDANRKIVKDEKGNKLRKPGLLKACKAVGWYIKEYDRAQVSINLTDFEVTPPHAAFDACCRVAEKYGARVTGSELVGLIPLEAVLAAGRHYLKKQGLSTGIPEKMIIQTAIHSLGLDELSPFDPNEKIIEYRVGGAGSDRLVDLSCRSFTDELSTDSPAPGGGSVAALCGALSAALAAMVGNLTADKRGFEGVKDEMIRVADRCQALKDAFLADVDRDTDAFNELMACMSLPGKTADEKNAKAKAITEATLHAAQIPLDVLKRTLEVAESTIIVVEKGNPNSVSDAGVALLSAKTACDGAYLNVIINLKDMEDSRAASMMEEAGAIRSKVHASVERGMKSVFAKLDIS